MLIQRRPSCSTTSIRGSELVWAWSTDAVRAARLSRGLGMLGMALRDYGHDRPLQAAVLVEPLRERLLPLR